MNAYSTTTVCDGRYIAKSGNAIINGNLAVNSSANINAFDFTTTASGGNFQIMSLLAPNSHIAGLTIGKARNTNESMHVYYKEPGIGGLCMFGKQDTITFTINSIALNATTTINGNLNVTGTITGKTNTTVTHYAPVEESITNYHIGKPVFLSGNVYRQQGNEWISSAAIDTTDCICSVKASGTYKKFVGIVTEIDVENNCITFAMHGDFLFSVDDAAQYQVGDVICYDGTVLLSSI